MKLSSLMLLIVAIAIVLTLVIGQMNKNKRKKHSWFMSFLQNFTGSLFIISGYVKLVDPLGTAYKMKDYFVELESAFAGSKMSFLAPLFPWLTNFTIEFGMLMIVFELILGVMLIIGAFPKFTSWGFFLLMLLFTFLTGFTYATGFVPEGVNFFSISEWGPFMDKNMKVKDCGCFGEFIKLKPKVTFLKDVFLLIPGLYFLFKHKSFHQLFNKGGRLIVSILFLIGFVIYGMSNYKWDIPDIDFRPFKVGVNIPEVRSKEEAAQQAVEVIGWEFEHQKSGERVVVMEPDYKTAKANYPKEKGWKVYDQVKTEPTMKMTKISEFELDNRDGIDVSDDLLLSEDFVFLIVSYNLYTKGTEVGSRIVRDTIWGVDTLTINEDSLVLIDKIEEIIINEEEYDKFIFEKHLVDDYEEVINPLYKGVKNDKYKFYVAVGGAGDEKIDQFIDEVEADYEFLTADEILLKTIIRSNPGIVLLKNGEIIQKWHINKLPRYSEIKAQYLN